MIILFYALCYAFWPRLYDDLNIYDDPVMWLYLQKNQKLQAKVGLVGAG